MKVRESTQRRAAKTRLSLKTAFIEAITEQGYSKTSIIEVATRANSSVGAFQNHFGTKKSALELFWYEYCEAVMCELQGLESDHLQRDNFEVLEFLNDISVSASRLQNENLGLNQAMNLHFINDRELHSKTREIMERVVAVIFRVVSCRTDHKISPMSAQISAQILITLNLNYALGGARLMPASPYERHRAIACAAAASIVNNQQCF